MLEGEEGDKVKEVRNLMDHLHRCDLAKGDTELVEVTLISSWAKCEKRE